MELRQLRYFLAVSEELHFGRAARRLHMSQPPLSTQIRQLEEEMRFPLFYRTKRKVELTEAGRVFAREARVILQQVEQATGLASEANRSKQSRLIVGCSPANSEVVVRILAAFKQRHPTLDLTVKSLPSPQQIDALRNSQIDLGFITVPSPHEGLAIEPLWREPLVVALPGNHPLALATASRRGQSARDTARRRSQSARNAEHRRAAQGKIASLAPRDMASGTIAPRGIAPGAIAPGGIAQRAIALRALERETLILFPLYMSPGRYESIADMCRKAGFNLNAVHEVDNIHTMLEMVSAGMGVALLRASARLIQNPFDKKSTASRSIAFRNLHHSPLVETALAYRPGHPIASLPDFITIARELSSTF